jgi:septal ring factor EnvC (AmiA/AmiB activator)
MNAIQLEFNLNNENETDIRISQIQNQVDNMNQSMDKVRKKLFAQMNELKKICADLKCENEDLKKLLGELKNEKTIWSYNQGECLFQVSS